MAHVGDSEIGSNYAIYCGDCIEVMAGLPDESVGFSIYSPPFGGLYNYSSSERDLSNARDYRQFFEHYEYAVEQKTRLTQSGRLSVVHCMDVPGGKAGLTDFPGDIIRLHEKLGWRYHDRKAIWKEPLKAAIRTRALGLRHSQIVKDSSECHSAFLDYVVVFRKRGQNKEPIAHPTGLSTYAGDWQAPPRPRPGSEFDLRELQVKYAGWKDQKTNKLSHWIWQRYASGVWDDIRIDRVLPYKKAREPEDEKHVHPLQLDVIDRCLILWSNPGDVVLSPFAGVGSEVYGAVKLGRRGIGIELKPSYYNQMIANVHAASKDWKDQDEQIEMDLGDAWADPESAEFEAMAAEAMA